MINFKIIFKVLGLLLFLEGFFIFLSAIVSLIYGESDFFALSITSLITVASGLVTWLFTRNEKSKIGKRESYIIVSLVWIIFSLFGSIPFIIHGSIPSYTDAFFETISGFTTTGASILNNIEELPHGLLFWRSITQWLGGMGMILMSLAILPMLGIGGMQLFVAEVPGPTPDKIHPRVKETAKRLWAIYTLFTIAETILLWFGGMDLFDSINHAFTTMATGGYSTKQASVAFYTSPYIQYVITFFMFLAGVNFTLAYFALKLNYKKIWQNEEFRYYIIILASFTLISSIALSLNKDYTSYEKAFRDSIFQVVSIITTTGFATADYTTWGAFLLVLYFIMMFIGGSAGSTGGGIKVMRILLLLKNSYLEFKRLIHPHAIILVRFNKRAVNQSIITNVLAFIVFYIIVFVAGTLFMAFLGLDIESAMGATIASLGNIGPGIGAVGPANNFFQIPDAGKWFLSFLMLMGRLELFTVLILFSPAFWKK